MISFSIAILTLGFILVCFSAYRSYIFHKLTYSELQQKLMSYRRVYNQMSANQRNTKYGKAFNKSISAIDKRMKQLETNVGRSTKGGGNYEHSL